MLGILNDIPSVKIDGDTDRYKLNKSHGLRTREAHTQYIFKSLETQNGLEMFYSDQYFRTVKYIKKQYFSIDSIVYFALSLSVHYCSMFNFCDRIF